jgi:hypothetical protein
MKGQSNHGDDGGCRSQTTPSHRSIQPHLSSLFVMMILMTMLVPTCNGQPPYEYGNHPHYLKPVPTGLGLGFQFYGSDSPTTLLQSGRTLIVIDSDPMFYCYIAMNSSLYGISYLSDHLHPPVHDVQGLIRKRLVG